MSSGALFSKSVTFRKLSEAFGTMTKWDRKHRRDWTNYFRLLNASLNENNCFLQLIISVLSLNIALRVKQLRVSIEVSATNPIYEPLRSLIADRYEVKMWDIADSFSHALRHNVTRDIARIITLGFCTFDFISPLKCSTLMLHFFPLKCSVSPQKVSKMHG